MDLYVLDSMLRRVEVFDLYKSLIWTERLSTIGDFELLIPVDDRALTWLTIGRRLAIRDSIRVMEIETVEKKNTDEGRFLTITGRSLEKILEDRVARHAMIGTDTEPTWKISGTPGNIVREIFKKICIDGILSPMDKIPFMQDGILFPPGTIDESKDDISVEIGPSNLYEIFKQILDPFNLGFRIIRNFDKSELYFEVYSGNNRTTNQRELPPVIFSPQLDNLSDVTELNSRALYKNVAYVFGKFGFEVVYSAEASSSTSGFDRRVVVVNASDITEPPGPNLTSLLAQKGREALSQSRPLFAFDGEVRFDSQFKYQTDYVLGDLLEVQNAEGASNWMRVTEQIFVSDKEGDRSYPTLALDLLIVPGTWDSYDRTEEWDESDEHWDDL